MQLRNHPPRVELARLTVRQYRQAAADLVGGFLGAGKWDGERGLRGEYFNDKHFRGDKRVLERRDAKVEFDFGQASPLADKIDPKEYCIRWQDAVLAPDTGEYEFTIKTDNGARLWVNDMRQPLVDAWVKSGDETEHRQSMMLLGGRVYPLRLEFFKSKDGKQEKGSIALVWKPPHRAAEPIPERNLSPNWFPETFVTTTPFPPDDRSTGYERGTSISKAWEQATTDAAIETAGLCPKPSRKSGWRQAGRRGPHRPAAGVLPPVRRAGVSAAAVGPTSAATLRRSPIRARRPTWRRPSSGSCCWR